jgi:protease I
MLPVASHVVVEVLRENADGKVRRAPMAILLMPLPNRDFDPTETGVPWRILSERGHRIVFATPDGKRGEADPKMLTGKGLGVLAPFLRADANGRAAYNMMARDSAFQQPLAYERIRVSDFDGVLLPGGHAKGMRPYLDSAILQSAVATFFERHKPVAAICHGVLVAARGRANGKSALYGRKTTGLTKNMELTAWALTCLYLGDYYRTYPVTVEDEVKGTLASADDFVPGPWSLSRDAPDKLALGFTLRDGNYLSARWPGDAHRFATDFAALLERPNA